jgi:uncharacterized protein (TIGR02147 family)
MINVYEKEDYRELFLDILEQAKQKPMGQALAQIAKKCGIQPSYLTNVLKQRCHFSADQASDLLTYLGYNTEEIDYVLLLIEYERTGSLSRRQTLKDKVKKIRQFKLRADNYVEAKIQKNDSITSFMNYYLDPLVPIIHMYFGLRAVEQTPRKIAEKLRVSEVRVANLINYLRQEHFIELKNGKYQQTALQLHLPKDSPLSKPHQILMRGLAQEHLARVETENHFAFTVTFNADENARARIQVEFLKYIKKCQHLCRESKSENVLQMHFDLFPWEF